MAVEDAATNPAVTPKKIQKLHERGITAMLGPMTSSNAQDVREYADQNDMLVSSCCSSDPTLAVAGDSVYRLAPDDSGLGSAMGRLAEYGGTEAPVPICRSESMATGCGGLLPTTMSSGAAPCMRV